jgi:hypothetical protein
MKGMIGAMLCVVCLVGIGFSAAADTYAFYYATAGDQETGVVIMNSGGTETDYLLKVYDAYGTLLDADSGDLDPFESDYVRLSVLAGHGEMCWGLALIESPAILTFGVETYVGETWLASDNVTDPIPVDLDETYYWYGLSYASTADQRTGVAIVNPGEGPASATVYLYDSLGRLENSFDVVLDPHETDYYNLETLLSVDKGMWGIVDVRATEPVVLAAEYLDIDGNLLNVDQVVYFYYSE